MNQLPYAIPAGYGFEGSAEAMTEAATLEAFMSLGEAQLEGLLTPLQAAAYVLMFFTLHKQWKHMNEPAAVLAADE